MKHFERKAEAASDEKVREEATTVVEKVCVSLPDCTANPDVIYLGPAERCRGFYYLPKRGQVSLGALEP